MRINLKLNSIIERPGCILSRSLRYQFLVTVIVNIISFAHGVGVGWLSPTLNKLQSSDSPLDFPVRIAEASWIGSLIGLGSLAGNIVFGYLLDRMGRKVCIYMIAVPHICLWVLIYCAQSVEFLYVGRFLAGITGGGSYVVVPIFLSEIADTSIRGTLSAMLMLSVNFGILCGFILSSYLDYHVVPFVAVILPLVYLVAAIFFPDTPQHLLRKGKIVSAEKAFRFYNNCVTSKDCNELQKCNQKFAELQSIIKQGNESSALSYRDFVTRPALKAIGTAIILVLVNQLSGSFAFVNYASFIFAQSGSPLEPNICTIIAGIMQILGVCTAIFFVDRCGRKLLTLLSTGGACVGLTMFGCFTFLGNTHDLSNFSWVPLILMMFLLFIYNIGIVSLTFVLLVEIFPVKIRSVAASVSFAVLSLLVFTMLKIFPIFLHSFGITYTMWSCASVCLVGSIYLMIFLKETKGKSMDTD